VSTYQWLLALHVTGSFLLIGGSVAAVTMRVFALRCERPSEIALFLSLMQVAVYAIYAGIMATLVFGLWLVHNAGYGYLDGWVIASLVLWVVGSAIGGVGGKRDEHARRTAERLVAAGDAPSPELHTVVRDPRTLALLWGSGLVFLVVLVLMIWKPGA
jgi:uncharacterized membrane protein